MTAGALPLKRTVEKKTLAESEFETPSDMDVVQKVLRGDPEAFSRLVERYRGHVFGIVRKHIPRDRVEETAQDAFVRAYRSLKHFKRPDGFKPWLSAIAVRTCYDYWRQCYRRKEISMSGLSEEQRVWLDNTVSLAADADREAMGRRREARELLDHALSRLSAENRMVLELVHLEGHSVREAADLLGWSVANVKVRAFRARQKLRKIINDIRRD